MYVFFCLFVDYFFFMSSVRGVCFAEVVTSNEMEIQKKNVRIFIAYIGKNNLLLFVNNGNSLLKALRSIFKSTGVGHIGLFFCHIWQI